MWLCRVVAAVVKDETTTDEVSSLVLEDCPIRMACHPSGRSLVLAMSKGGLVHVDISIPGHGGAPVLTLASGATFRLHDSDCCHAYGHFALLSGHSARLHIARNDLICRYPRVRSVYNTAFGLASRRYDPSIRRAG